MAPASAMVITVNREDPFNSVTTNTTIVENKAEPAARPSRPSIRLKALVMARTHKIVKGKPTNHGR